MELRMYPHKTILRFPTCQARNERRHGGTRLAGLALILLCGMQMPALATVFYATDLVTNNQAANPALITDPQLVNAWGIAASGTSPFWVGDNGSGLSTLYTVNPTTGVTTKSATVVSIPGDGTVTGVSFNSATAAGAFNADNFLFVSEDGTVSGWRGALGTNAEVLFAGTTANVYKGDAFATVAGHSYLYAANFRTGAINIFKGDGAAPSLTGNFVDPNIPAGYAPFDIKLLGSTLYVTYALQDGAKHDDVAGLGNGFVSAFDLQGNFLARIASQGSLDSPWGLALAPASFGGFAGDLLVGNFGDGTISAYNLTTDAFAGQLLSSGGGVLSIDGLWALAAGNGGNGGNTQSIYFSAGPNDESNGLFGVINPAPEPFTLAMFGAGLIGAVALRRRKTSRKK
jgi:uncharacterized protein (TIGR03118 family)